MDREDLKAIIDMPMVDRFRIFEQMLESVAGVSTMYSYKHGEFFIFESISISEIIDFTQNFNIDQRNRRCNKELILKFLNKAKSNHFIENWNIAVASNKEGEDFFISPSI